MGEVNSERKIIISSESDIVGSVTVIWKIKPLFYVDNRDREIIVPKFSISPDDEVHLSLLKSKYDDLHIRVLIDKQQNFLWCTLIILEDHGREIFRDHRNVTSGTQFQFTHSFWLKLGTDIPEVVVCKLVFEAYGVMLSDIIESNKSELTCSSGYSNNFSSSSNASTSNEKAYIIHAAITNTREENFEVPQGLQTHQSANQKSLANDVKKIYETSLHTDVTLKIGKDHIAAHKAILCARSPVFAKMFNHEMTEQVNNTVEITDVEFDVFKKFIHYLYGKELDDVDLSSLCSLYYIADKYEVLNLRLVCGNMMVSKLDIGNACRILALADFHKDEVLKSRAVEFISCNLKEVAKTRGWVESMDNKLTAEIIVKSKLVL